MTAYAQEIKGIHQFFEDWFNARLEQTEANFARFTDTVADNFHIIGPNGQMTARLTLVDVLWKAHGQRPGVRLWVENIRLHYHLHDLLLVTYEEWQQQDENTTSRLSTVLFQETPDGLRWLHVHETWFGKRI